MRLTNAEIDAILACSKRHFGERCIVRVFGSRTDDSRRGGDIDLHIEAQTRDLARLTNELEFREELQDLLGEQRVDVIVRAPNYAPRAIDRIAVETGLSL